MKFLGGMYAVALPTQEYAVLYPGSHIESIWGRIDLPGFDILEFDITAHDGGKLAGKAQSDDPAKWGTWLWRAKNRHWERVSAFAHGTYPAIFANDGTLVIADPAQHGSQGFRYVAEDGRLVSGDDTLNHQRRVAREHGITGLWNYTFLGGVWFGQGETGCDVIIDGVRRRLLDGDTHFIRVKHIGGAWGVGMTLLAQREAHTFRLTRAELSMLPTLPPITSIPVPPTPIPVIQPPKPEPLPVSIPNLSYVVRAVSDAHPHLISQNTAETVKELYWRCVWALHKEDPNFGFLSKNAGENHHVIAGHRVAVDAVAYRGSDEVVDFIGSAGDGPGTGSIGWGIDERRPSNLWIQPVAYPGEAVPIPGPVPPIPGPQPAPDTELAKRVHDLTRRVERMEQAGFVRLGDLIYRP
jgi:hypothetical protein